MKTILLSGAAVAALFIGGTAVAQSTKAPVAASAKAPAAAARKAAQPATRAEVQALAATTFGKLDANKDGFVSKEELAAVETRREQKLEQRASRIDPGKLFTRLDTNKDGKITVAEANAGRPKAAQAKGKPAAQPATFQGLFARADANKDGVITSAELNVIGQQVKTQLEKVGERQDAMATRMFTLSDTNKDGRLSLAEMQQSSLARFDKLDANKDGKITADERQKARTAAKAQRKPS